MADGIVNPDLTLIPDKAEVWIALKSDVTDAATLIPNSVSVDLLTLGWEFGGYIDADKGISISPSVEFKEYDAFGHPRFRTKTKKGKLDTGFTLLETNETTRKIVLPGSAPNKVGIPKDVQVYVLYKYIDEDRTTIWAQLTPAATEQKGDSGIIDGELRWFEMTIHHTANAAGDVFEIITDSTDDVSKVFTIASGVTAYTATAGANTTPSITTLTAPALQTALRALASVAALPSPGVTVTGTGGAPGTLTAVFTAAITPVSATGTGGTVTVA
jgi:hypothetical protein